MQQTKRKLASLLSPVLLLITPRAGGELRICKSDVLSPERRSLKQAMISQSSVRKGLG